MSEESENDSEIVFDIVSDKVLYDKNNPIDAKLLRWYKILDNEIKNLPKEDQEEARNHLNIVKITLTYNSDKAARIAATELISAVIAVTKPIMLKGFDKIEQDAKLGAKNKLDDCQKKEIVILCNKMKTDNQNLSWSKIHTSVSERYNVSRKTIHGIHNPTLKK